MLMNIFILSITYYLFNTSTSESINSLIPSLVNDDISKTDQGTVNLITVGRLAPWKNIDTIIKSVNLLKQYDMKFKLFIVGSGPLESELKKLVSDLNLSSEVIFTGQKKYTELTE